MLINCEKGEYSLSFHCDGYISLSQSDRERERQRISRERHKSFYEAIRAYKPLCERERGRDISESNSVRLSRALLSREPPLFFPSRRYKLETRSPYASCSINSYFQSLFPNFLQKKACGRKRERLTVKRSNRTFSPANNRRGIVNQIRTQSE